MIVVTGYSRTGTSLTMRILKALGYDTPATEFTQENIAYDHLNPDGFYEMPYEFTNNGLNTHQYKGQAVKLPWDHLLRTQPKYISKLIVCWRDVTDTVESNMKLYKSLWGTCPSKEAVEKDYMTCYDEINGYYDAGNVDHFIMNLRVAKYKIPHLCDWLGIGRENVEKAQKLVRG